MLEALRGDPILTIACSATLECVGVGVAVGWGQADLADDSGDVAHRGRLHESTENPLKERVQ